MNKPNFRHWTSYSLQNYRFSVVANFLCQLEKQREELGITQADVGTAVGVTQGRASQVFNNPGNISLESAIKYAQALRLRVSLIAYDDGRENQHAPVNPEIFVKCWEAMGKPLDFFELEEFIRENAPNFGQKGESE